MDWKDFFDVEKQKSYFIDLMNKVDLEYENYICYPDYNNIFNAFLLTPLDKVKVVILGQDPYHEPNQAHGLAFSVLVSKLPPSLVNIYKEISSDLEVEVIQDGNLDYLAKQGVLLLNTILTVRDNKALSHRNLGWETFTDNVIKYLNKLNQPIVYILWGKNAISKTKFLNNPNHLILTSVHPSPLSSYRGFFGSKPFSKTNEFLRKSSVEEIKWTKA